MDKKHNQTVTSKDKNEKDQYCTVAESEKLIPIVKTTVKEIPVNSLVVGKIMMQIAIRVLERQRKNSAG